MKKIIPLDITLEGLCEINKCYFWSISSNQPLIYLK